MSDLNQELPAVDDYVVLDEASVNLAPALPGRIPLAERIATLEGERQAAFNQMHRMVADIGALKSDQDRWQRETETAQIEVFYRMALLAEFRTGGGSAKVLRLGVMSAMLAHAMGGDDWFCDRMMIAAPLLDIGEIALPEALLTVVSLSDVERELMRSHCRQGHALLAGSESGVLQLAAEIALGHHERFDGSGYPMRLAGNDIPLSCRIVSVIDCFDALTLPRPYRPAHSPAAALEMILAGIGTQFDPEVIEAFRRVSEGILMVRWVLDDAMPQPEGRQWLGRSPEPGFWRRFVS